MDLIRILILEDDPTLLKTLDMLFSGEPSFSSVRCARTGREALEILKAFRPDIALVDLGLPDMDGPEFIRQAKNTCPDVEFMAYTVHDDVDLIFSAIKAGATGYVLKGCSPKELIESVLDLYRGGVPMSPKVARALIREFQAFSPGEVLTSREMNILKELDHGHSYKEIASRLKISYHTVHTHIKRIYEKLHARGRREAIKKARLKGLL